MFRVKGSGCKVWSLEIGVKAGGFGVYAELRVYTGFKIKV